MKKTDRRILKTKNGIRNAFLKLLQEKPLSSISITELARVADIDRRTFYLHYSCIEDIITEMENEIAVELNKYTAEHDFDINDFFEFLTNLMMKNIEYYRYTIRDDSYNRFQKNCKIILKKFIKTSFFKSSSLEEAEFDLYAEYITSGVVGVYSVWLRSELKLSLDELTHLTRIAVSDAWGKINS